MPPPFASKDCAARTRGRALLRAIAEGTAGAVGDEFLRSLVRHLALAFGAKLAFVAEATQPDGTHVRLLAAWYDGDFWDEAYEYDTKGQPCALVVEHAVVAFPEALTLRFPEDEAAISMGIESYLAICLRAADGTHLGHLAVLDASPMEADDEDIAVLRIFASRAAAELERRRQAAALAASRERVIEAADAERRRVGRDLHDGAQQRLMAVSNLLTTSRRKLSRGASDVGPLLDLAAQELSGANAELRDLARGLHPVALAERGLRDALEALAAGCALPVELEVPDLSLPQSAALAAYFLVAESLTNVARYAQASSARVRAAVEDGALHVEVTTTGPAGPTPPRAPACAGLRIAWRSSEAASTSIAPPVRARASERPFLSRLEVARARNASRGESAGDARPEAAYRHSRWAANRLPIEVPVLDRTTSPPLPSTSILHGPWIAIARFGRGQTSRSRRLNPVQSRKMRTGLGTLATRYACINGGGHHRQAANEETINAEVSAAGSFEPKNGRVVASLSAGPVGRRVQLPARSAARARQRLVHQHRPYQHHQQRQHASSRRLEDVGQPLI